MDVSLEEIIKRKRTTKKGKFQPRFKAAKPAPKNGGFKAKPKLKVGDARMKIIQQNRTKLVDARDKLAQLAKKTDARLKLQKLRKQNTNAPPTKRRQNVGNNRFTLSTNKSGQISLSSKKDFARRPVALQRSIKNDFIPRALPLHRTIVNDDMVPLSRMPPLPDIAPMWEGAMYRDLGPVRKPEPVIPKDLNMRITFKQNPRPISRDMISDDEDGDYPMGGPRMSYPPLGGKRPVRPVSPEPGRMSGPGRGYPVSSGYYPPQASIRSGSRMQTIDLTDSIHSRLDVSPPPIRSMGILSAGGASRGSLNVNRSRSQHSQHSMQEYNSPQGYRIVVSNLQSNVTQEDIKELFEDVGELLESRLVRPGTAEVIFKTLIDAQQAVDVYHNRQLDGQPMKCLLVNPRLGNKPTAPALRPASHLRAQHGSNRKVPAVPKSSVEPDIEAFHRVMFKRRHTSS